jgi:hypothetical protein
MAGNAAGSGTIKSGQLISLTQPSMRRRQYEMRAGERALGWLRLRPGRCSRAEAEGRGIGPMELTARRRHVLAAGPGGAETLATVDRRRGGAVIHASDGHALRWEKRAPGNRWAIYDRGERLLSVIAFQGLLRPSVRILVERPMPERTAILLCLLAGYLALSELHIMSDASAAIAGMVAAAHG